MTAAAKKRVAVTGSSGGGVGNVGREAKDVVATISEALELNGMVLSALVLVMADCPFDTIGREKETVEDRQEETAVMNTDNNTTHAALWTLDQGTGNVVPTASGSLSTVNAEARRADARLAARVDARDVDALVVMSCDPHNVNAASIAACARTNTPITGTGGTSISEILLLGGNVIGVSGGSVATSPAVLAASNATALAQHFGIAPSHPPSLSRLSLSAYHSVMDATLPIVLAVSLLSAMLVIAAHALVPRSSSDNASPFAQQEEDAQSNGTQPPAASAVHWDWTLLFPYLHRMQSLLGAALLSPALSPWLPSRATLVDSLARTWRAVTRAPATAAAVLTVTRQRASGVEALLAAVLAISMLPTCNALTGIVVASLVCALLPHVCVALSRLGCPATAAAILGCPIAASLAAAATTLALGTVQAALLAAVNNFSVVAGCDACWRVVEAAGDWVASVLVALPSAMRLGGVGAVIGVAVLHTSNFGWYHFFVLPLILLEMQAQQQLLMLEGVATLGSTQLGQQQQQQQQQQHAGASVHPLNLDPILELVSFATAALVPTGAVRAFAPLSLFGAHDMCALCLTSAGVCAGAAFAQAVMHAFARGNGTAGITGRHRVKEKRRGNVEEGEKEEEEEEEEEQEQTGRGGGQQEQQQEQQEQQQQQEEADGTSRCRCETNGKHRRRLGMRGLWINVAFGDYVEAGIALAQDSSSVLAASYIGAALSGAIIHMNGITASAYLPVPLIVLLSQAPMACALACTTAFVPPFLAAAVVEFTRQPSP